MEHPSAVVSIDCVDDLWPHFHCTQWPHVNFLEPCLPPSPVVSERQVEHVGGELR